MSCSQIIISTWERDVPLNTWWTWLHGYNQVLRLLNGRIFAYYAGVSRILRKVATVNTATGIFQLLEEDISISALELFSCTSCDGRSQEILCLTPCLRLKKAATDQRRGHAARSFVSSLRLPGKRLYRMQGDWSIWSECVLDSGKEWFDLWPPPPLPPYTHTHAGDCRSSLYPPKWGQLAEQGMSAGDILLTNKEFHWRPERSLCHSCSPPQRAEKCRWVASWVKVKGIQQLCASFGL